MEINNIKTGIKSRISVDSANANYTGTNINIKERQVYRFWFVNFKFKRENVMSLFTTESFHC